MVIQGLGHLVVSRPCTATTITSTCRAVVLVGHLFLRENEREPHLHLCSWFLRRCLCSAGDSRGCGRFTLMRSVTLFDFGREVFFAMKSVYRDIVTVICGLYTVLV